MSIADAYVDLHVDGDGFESEVRRTIKTTKTDKESGDLGDRIGSRIVSRLVASLLKEGSAIDGVQGLFKNLGDAAGAVPTQFVAMGAAIVAAVPLITSSLSAVAGAASSLVGVLVEAGGAALPLAGFFTAAAQGAIVGKIAFGGLGKAIGGDKKAMDALSPAARGMAKSLQGIGKEWAGVKTSIQGKVFEGLKQPIKDIGSTLLPVLKTGLGGTGFQLNLLLKDIAKFATSKGFVSDFSTVLTGNTAIFAGLRQAAVPVLSGILTLLKGIMPAAIGLAGGVGGVAKGFNGWAKGLVASGKLNAIIVRGIQIFGDLWNITKNVGGVIIRFFSAASGPGIGLLGTISKISDKLKGVATGAGAGAIEDWAQGGIDALKTVGGFISKVFNGLSGVTGGGVLGKLFDPKTLEVYMNVLGQIFDAVMPIVKILKDAFQPVVMAIGKAFQDLAPRIMPLFVALGPLLKGVMAVIANIVSQAFDFIGMIAEVITPIVSFISNLIGPILERFAPIIATIILAFTNWGGALVRLVPIVGKFVAPIVEFSSFLFSKMGPVIEWLGMLIGKVFGFIGTFIGSNMGLVMSIFGKVFGAIKTVVGGAVSFVWLVITKYVGLWLSVFGKVGEIALIVGRAFGAALGAVKSKAGEILTWIGGWIGKVITVFTGLIGKVTTIGGDIIRGLWEGFKGLAGWVKDKIMALIYSIVPEPIRKILGINSPSRVAADIMQDFGRGMVVGTQDSVPMVSRASSDLGANAAMSMAGALPANLGVGSTTSNSATTYGNISVTIAVDDLAKMNKVNDFLAMLDNSRVRSRQTARSGQVAV